jgi:hypothetical protein
MRRSKRSKRTREAENVPFTKRDDGDMDNLDLDGDDDGDDGGDGEGGDHRAHLHSGFVKAKHALIDEDMEPDEKAARFKELDAAHRKLCDVDEGDYETDGEVKSGASRGVKKSFNMSAGESRRFTGISGRRRRPGAVGSLIESIKGN